jgi:acetyltransferase-like isoleucine patch superfamily enzyme
MKEKIIYLLRFLKRTCLFILNKNLNLLQFKRQNVLISNNFRISGKLFVSNKGIIKIDDFFIANSGKNMNPIGGDIILRLICLKGAQIVIGKNVGMSNSTILSQSKIRIDDNVMIGGSCRIWDTDFHSLNDYVRGTDLDIGKSIPIHIKKNVFIGAGSIILKGITIGEYSIIAAGSVVSKSIPSNEIWGGNPAKFIRKK